MEQTRTPGDDLAECTTVLTRICECLSCDGTELTLVDQSMPVQIEDVVVERVVLPRVAQWRRLQRDGRIVAERDSLAAGAR